jgi:hypothetical protein
MQNHSKSRRILLSIAFLLATICSATPARAAEVFNVKAFGAVGNGVHDHTAAIQKAITAATQKPGSIVEFPGGDCLYSNALQVSGTKLMGENSASLDSANNSAEVDLTGAGSEASNLSFVTPPAATNVGVAIRVTSDGAGIIDFSGEDGTMQDNVISNMRDGLFISHAGNLRVLGNQIDSMSGTAVVVDTSDIVAIQSNKLTSAAQGINLFAASNVTATDNHLSKIQSIAIQSTGVVGGATNLTNNEISDAGLSLQAPTPAAVIYVNMPAADTIVVDRNTYRGNTAHLQYFIWCVQGPPRAIVAGNETNTLLPNRVGS